MDEDFVSFEFGGNDEETDFNFDSALETTIEKPKLNIEPQFVILPQPTMNQPIQQTQMNQMNQQNQMNQINQMNQQNTNQINNNFNVNNLNNTNFNNYNYNNNNTNFYNPNQPVHQSKSPIPQPVFITPFTQTESSSVDEMRTEAIEGSRNDTKQYNYGNEFAEPPLLEELGIDFKQISQNILTKLNPFSKKEINESDAVGSLIFGLLLGLICLFMKKFKFGYIYGFTIIGSILEYFVLNLLATSTIPYSIILTHLGYSSYPLIVLSIVHLFVNNSKNIWVILLTIGMATWSTYSCGKFFIKDQGFMAKKAIVYYPIALYFILFVLLVLF